MGWFANWALVLISLIISILLIELGLRLFAAQRMSGIVFEFAPRGYPINKSSGAALFDVGENKGVYYFVPPHLRGLRPPRVDAIRVLALGDSYTFGWYLSEEDTYVARLQKEIDLAFGTDRIELLNAGVAGSGTAEHLAFLEDFGDEIAPRAVFVFVSFDDFGRALRSPLYRLRSPDTIELDEGTVPISKLREALFNSDVYNFAIEHLHIAQLIRKAVRNAVSHIVYASDHATSSALVISDQNTSNEQRLARALFRRMKAWCDARYVKLAVINNGWGRYDWLADALASEKITYFDAAPKVQPAILSDGSSYVYREGHPNAKGARLTANAVWPFIRKFISENGLAPQLSFAPNR
jgi:lysophospholipase L1-like esterase